MLLLLFSFFCLSGSFSEIILVDKSAWAPSVLQRKTRFRDCRYEIYFQAVRPSCHPTNGVEALKGELKNIRDGLGIDVTSNTTNWRLKWEQSSILPGRVMMRDGRTDGVCRRMRTTSTQISAELGLANVRCRTVTRGRTTRDDGPQDGRSD